MLEIVLNILFPLLIMLEILIPALNFTFFVKPNSSILIKFSIIVYILIGYFLINAKVALPIYVMPLSIFTCLLLIYKNFFISAIFSAFIWILLFISDAITGAILIYLLKYNYSDINDNLLLNFMSELLILLNVFVLSKIIRLILLKISSRIDINIKISNKPPIAFIISILLIIFLYYQYSLKDFVVTWNKNMFLFNALNLFIFFILITTITYYCFTILTNKHKSKEYSQLQTYTNMLENMYSDLRSFKHDYLNILSTLAGYIEIEDINGLKNYYYNDLLPESDEIVNKDTSLSYLSHIKISPLKALLSSKIVNAHSKGIDVKIEMADDIELINMSVIDICRIIGILLDNAIEASILCDNKFIHFAAINTDNEVIFNIRNSCLSSTPPIHKLYQKNFSTKGAGRGLGLNNVKDIINKRYKNVLFNTTIENCIFVQELLIRNK